MSAEPPDRTQARLLDMFPPASQAAWRALVEKELGGAPFEQRLVTRTIEGIDLQPMYWQHDVAGVPLADTLPGEPPWAICQTIAAETPGEWGGLARAAIAQGATALGMRLGQGPGSLPLTTMQELRQSLDGIDLGQIPIFIAAGAGALQAAAWLAALAEERGLPPSALAGSVESDPLGDLALAGALPLSLERAYDELAQGAAWAAERAPRLRTVAVRSAPYHESGADAVQELAFTLATGVAYLRALLARGVPLGVAAARVRLSFGLGARLFTEIAKLRAARLLWRRVVAAFGGDLEVQRAGLAMHAHSATYNVTLYDPHVNLLRATLAALAAAVAGCESLEVGCFDTALGPPGPLARRLALSTQHLLAHESHLGRVLDPAAGSWYVESLTDTLARRAWELFQEVERRGGMAQALSDGFPQRQVAETAALRAERLATRRDVLVGTTVYAAPAAAQPAAPAAPAVAQRPSPDPSGVSIEPLPRRRAAEPFEELRRRVEALPEQPRAFLASVGPPPQLRARAEFAAGFLAVAGIAVDDAPGFADVDGAARAAIASGAPIVVICGADATYPELVPPLVAQIRAARPQTVVALAGFPRDQAEALRAAGVDVFIHQRADALATLGAILDRLPPPGPGP